MQRVGVYEQFRVAGEGSSYENVHVGAGWLGNCEDLNGVEWALERAGVELSQVCAWNSRLWGPRAGWLKGSVRENAVDERTMLRALWGLRKLPDD
jgi:hypothetical protein